MRLGKDDSYGVRPYRHKSGVGQGQKASGQGDIDAQAQGDINQHEINR